MSVAERVRELSPEDFDEVAEPDEFEGHDDFIERCVVDLQNANPGLEDDDAEQVCEMQWSEMGGDAERAAKPVLRKTHIGPVRNKEFILSDESVDRLGDVISVAGWDLTNFKGNPVVLFGHRSDMPPIGLWKNLRVENGALRGTLDLAEEGTSPRIDEIRRLVQAGILKAVSVGFRPVAHEAIKGVDGKPTGGFRFTKQELLEASLVSVPANPNALAVAKSLRVSPQTIDLVFGMHAKRDGIVRRGLHGKHAKTIPENGKGSEMPSLAPRIVELQGQIVSRRQALADHLDQMDDTNVSDADLEIQKQLNQAIAQLRKTHDALVESEKLLGASADDGGGGTSTSRALVTTSALTKVRPSSTEVVAAPAIVRQVKEHDPLDYIVRAFTTLVVARAGNMLPEQARQKTYGDDEPTKIVCDLLHRGIIPDVVERAASAPAITTVTGWAAELVQQIYTDLMPLLLPHAILTRLAAKGLALSFGRAGRIIIPTRNATPTLAGSFVGEGSPIPVRQGAFSSQTLVPKKVAVISSWTKEMSEFSTPAIEGVIRDAVQQDTQVAVDSVLIDANAATVVRPAGLMNGITPLTGTTGGGLTAIVGDITKLVNQLTANTKGNIRSPVWLINPQEVNTAALAMSSLGTFPFRDELARGTLNNIPYIDSGTVPLATLILIDAADFVVVGEEGARIDLSDQASLHFEDTAPLDISTPGTPPTVASPVKSLFQTDSIALRLVMRLNWLQRRTGTIVAANTLSW